MAPRSSARSAAPPTPIAAPAASAIPRASCASSATSTCTAAARPASPTTRAVQGRGTLLADESRGRLGPAQRVGDRGDDLLHVLLHPLCIGHRRGLLGDHGLHLGDGGAGGERAAHLAPQVDVPLASRLPGAE